MELYQLEQFKTAAELSHITKAARLLHISQPALSKNIRALERELGYPLFDHIGKTIRLNKNGEILLKYTRDILESVGNIHRELAEQNGVSDSSISLCVKAASKLLPEILRGFLQTHENVRFSVSQFSLAAETGQSFDFTIDSSLSASSSGESLPLLREDLLIALPANHRLASGLDVDLSELKEESFISLQKGMGLSTIMNYYCQLSGFSPRIIFESDSPSTLRSLIHLGLGIALIPRLTWPGLEDDTIRLLPVRNLTCIRHIILHWNSRRYLTPAALEFKEYLISFFSNLAGNTDGDA